MQVHTGSGCTVANNAISLLCNASIDHKFAYNFLPPNTNNNNIYAGPPREFMGPRTNFKCGALVYN